MSPETRKRNGEELKAHFDKRFVGDQGQIVNITADFKEKRFREIVRAHEVASSVRVKSDGNRPKNKYLEYTNSGGVFTGNPYTSGAFAEQAVTRDRDRCGFDQLVRRPVGREVVSRVLPRLLVGKRPPPPKEETYTYVPPLMLKGLPCRWRDTHPGLNAPYATEELVLPAPEVPAAPMGALTLGATPIAHDWDTVINNLTSLEEQDPAAIMLFLQVEYHSRFRISRKDLFAFLLYRVNLAVMGELFVIHPAQLQTRLQDLLSPADQALIFS